MKSYKSYDVSIDSVVNVLLPADVNPDSDEGIELIYKLALAKFQKRIADPGEISLDWERYEDNDVTVPDDVDPESDAGKDFVLHQRREIEHLHPDMRVLEYADNYCEVSRENETVTFKGPCSVTGKSMSVTVNKNDLSKYRDGAYIQDAFPNLSPGDREFLMTGTSDEGWDILYGGDDEDEDDEDSEG